MQLSRDHVRSLSVLTELMMTLTIKTQVSVYSPWGFALLRNQPPQNAALIGSLTSNPWTVKGVYFPWKYHLWHVTHDLGWFLDWTEHDTLTLAQWPADLFTYNTAASWHTWAACDVTVQRSEGLVEHPVCRDDASWFQIALLLESLHVIVFL